MIPITRKELYLNKIVGNNEYETPEKPISEEEFFFAEILGEAVQAPEPLTRYQMYLAKIAGRNIEIPYPEVRLEYFLARAAGMEIEAPTPITREEMFWADYALIVEKELSGIPPLTFNAVAGTLKNYRIYGNTVNGESVGDRTENVLNELPQNRTNKGITFTNYDNKYIRITGISSDAYAQTDAAIIYLEAGTYSIRFFAKNSEFNTNIFAILRHLDNTNIIAINANGGTFTLNNGETIRFVTGVIQNNVEINTDVYYMFIKQSQIPDEYEPYGYRIPITNNAETANIYLDEPLTKQGDNADYIDYATQKRHNSDGTESSVTLPEIAVTAGTNTLTVGTEVQPSNVYIKYEGERQ